MHQSFLEMHLPRNNSSILPAILSHSECTYIYSCYFIQFSVEPLWFVLIPLFKITIFTDNIRIYKIVFIFSKSLQVLKLNSSNTSWDDF